MYSSAEKHGVDDRMGNCSTDPVARYLSYHSFEIPRFRRPEVLSSNSSATSRLVVLELKEEKFEPTLKFEEGAVLWLSTRASDAFDVVSSSSESTHSSFSALWKTPPLIGGVKLTHGSRTWPIWYAFIDRRVFVEW